MAVISIMAVIGGHMDIRQLSQQLGDAINEAIRRSDAVSDAVAELNATGYAVSSLTLDMTVSGRPLSIPVPIEPSVSWLERLYKLEAR
jgi:hypothetical protein